MSAEVLEAQKWLNSTYGGRAGYQRVEETGLPGSATSAALVSALQIELGMSTVTGVFGEQTEAEAKRYGIPVQVARQATMDALVELIAALRD